MSAAVWEQLKASARRGVLADRAARAARPAADAVLAPSSSTAATTRRSVRPTRAA